MSILYKTTALADEIELFYLAALKGVLHESGDEPAPFKIGSQDTPISYGLSEGYSPQDVAHFYIARELGKDWMLKVFQNIDESIMQEIKRTFESFRDDVKEELRFLRSSQG